jgi:hypothetical protein
MLTYFEYGYDWSVCSTYAWTNPHLTNAWFVVLTALKLNFVSIHLASSQFPSFIIADRLLQTACHLPILHRWPLTSLSTVGVTNSVPRCLLLPFPAARYLPSSHPNAIACHLAKPIIWTPSIQTTNSKLGPNPKTPFGEAPVSFFVNYSK